MTMHLFSVPKQSPVPRVLTDVLCHRLSLTNSVIRRVRKMGFGIIDVSLTSRDSTPVISISIAHAQSVKPLLDEATPGSFFYDGEIVSITLGGVRVVWIRPELLEALSVKSSREVCHAN